MNKGVDLLKKGEAWSKVGQRLAEPNFALVSAPIGKVFLGDYGCAAKLVGSHGHYWLHLLSNEDRRGAVAQPAVSPPMLCNPFEQVHLPFGPPSEEEEETGDGIDTAAMEENHGIPSFSQDGPHLAAGTLP